VERGAEGQRAEVRAAVLAGQVVERELRAHVYNNFALDALFSFMRSSTMDLAGHGGVDFFMLDPFWMQLRLGVKGKMAAGPLVLVFDPAIFFGLTKRSDGNKEAINIPARVGFMVLPQLNVGLSVALGGPFDGFGDGSRIAPQPI